MPVVVSGGVGDTVLAFPFIHELRRLCGDVVVYANHPKVYKLFMEDECHHTNDFPGYDYWITVNAIVDFTMTKKFNWFPPEVGALYTNYVERSKPWKHLIRHHPYMDHELQRKAIREGLTRETLPFHLLGMEYRGHQVFTAPNELESPALECLKGQRYITVHNGFETSQKIRGRSTKNYHPTLFSDFVRMFRARNFPGVKVVQLGGPTGPSTDFVDYDFKDRLTMAESLYVLSRSLCHVDGDSGLVHAAAVLGVPAVVLWGPTDPRYYGHKEHVHLTGTDCVGGCFWLKEDWMSQCPLGYSRPLCLDSISPMTIYGWVCKVIDTGRSSANPQSTPQTQPQR